MAKYAKLYADQEVDRKQIADLTARLGGLDHAALRSENEILKRQLEAALLVQAEFKTRVVSSEEQVTRVQGDLRLHSFASLVGQSLVEDLLRRQGESPSKRMVVISELCDSLLQSMDKVQAEAQSVANKGELDTAKNILQLYDACIVRVEGDAIYTTKEGAALMDQLQRELKTIKEGPYPARLEQVELLAMKGIRVVKALSDCYQSESYKTGYAAGEKDLLDRAGKAAPIPLALARQLKSMLEGGSPSLR